MDINKIKELSKKYESDMITNFMKGKTYVSPSDYKKVEDFISDMRKLKDFKETLDAIIVSYTSFSKLKKEISRLTFTKLSSTREVINKIYAAYDVDDEVNFYEFFKTISVYQDIYLDLNKIIAPELKDTVFADRDYEENIIRIDEVINSDDTIEEFLIKHPEFNSRTKEEE